MTVFFCCVFGLNPLCSHYKDLRFLIMKNFIYLALAAFQCSFLPVQGLSDRNILYSSEENKSIVVNNRVLAKVNGKAISVLDIMKKMDVLFYQNFPEYTSSNIARFQFYQANWKKVLSDLVDKELILADAEENKLQVSAGDVRQDMEQFFGPNVHATLDKIGISFEEAWKSVHSDIVLKRMIAVRTNGKAMKQVTPQAIREYYEQFAKENIRPETWNYFVVTIREKDKKRGAEAAQIVYQWLANEHVSLENIEEKAKSLESTYPFAKISTSAEFNLPVMEMSPAYKEILSKLTPGTYSQPAKQKSRTDSSSVHRIFYLKGTHSGGPIPFNEVVNKIKDKLFGEAMEKEMTVYLKRLRKHFDVQESHLDEMVSGGYEPFRLS